MGHSRPATQHELPLWSCMNRANIILKSWCNCWNISHRSAVHILMGIVEEKKKIIIIGCIIWEQKKILFCECINSIWLLKEKKKKKDWEFKVYRWETFYAKLLYPEGRIMQQPPHPWKIWKKKRVWKLKTDISDIEQFSNSKNKCWNKLPQNDQFLLLVYLQIMIHVRISPNPCCF